MKERVTIQITLLYRLTYKVPYNQGFFVSFFGWQFGEIAGLVIIHKWKESNFGSRSGGKVDFF